MDYLTNYIISNIVNAKKITIRLETPEIFHNFVTEINSPINNYHTL